MAEEKGILATTPQRTTAILQVHFFYVLVVLYGQSGGKKALSHSKTYKNSIKYHKASKYKKRGGGGGEAQ